MQITQARQLGEMRIGRELSEDEFQSALEYAQMKAAAQGHGPDYVPLLLPDVIQEREFQEQTWMLHQAMIAAEKDLKEARTTWKHENEPDGVLERVKLEAPWLLKFVSAAELRSVLSTRG